MDEKFVVTPKTERSVTMTIRIDTEYNQKLEEIALKSGRSRNELINMAIKFAFDHIEFIDSSSQKK
jgi:predicted transcriptional regulator